MAIETLRGVLSIGGFGIRRKRFFQRQDHPIEINDRSNTITFKIQDGPVKEAGVNGCQVDTLIETALIMIAGLNNKFPCNENENVIVYLNLALQYLEARKARREIKGIEGTSAEVST